MIDFAYSFHNYVELISVFFAPIIGIRFWKKQRTRESFVLALGILIIALGILIKIITTLIITLMHVIDNATKIPDFPLSLHIGLVIETIGIIVTVVGFALVTWKMKKIHNKANPADR